MKDEILQEEIVAEDVEVEVLEPEEAGSADESLTAELEELNQRFLRVAGC